MVFRKNHPPLYESIRDTDGKKSLLRVPDWLDAPNNKPNNDPDEKNIEKSSNLSTQSTPSTTQNTTIYRANPTLKSPIFQTIASTLIIILIIGIAFFLGQEFQKKQILAQQSDYDKLIKELDENREVAANYGLIPPSVSGVSDRGDIPGGGTDLPLSNTKTAYKPSNDPRAPGLNYFRLVQIPESSISSGEKAIEFLSAHGVDAALIPIKNGRYYKLMALQGFDQPNSDPEAKTYRQKLLTLGRKWKSEHKGSSNWSDMYIEKYRPGRN